MVSERSIVGLVLGPNNQQRAGFANGFADGMPATRIVGDYHYRSMVLRTGEAYHCEKC